MSVDEGVESGPVSTPRAGWRAILLMALWSGLASGLLELALLTLRVKGFERGVFLRSIHLPWMLPLSDVVLFLACGLALALPCRLWPRLTPALPVGFFLLLGCMGQLLLIKGLNSLACLLMGAGIARAATPLILARSRGAIAWMKRSAPVMVGAWLALVAWSFWGESFSGRGAYKTQPAPDGARNVLLIMLDTVRADRLSLYGYARETTPNLSRLAEGGVRFETAHSTAPWTLPSHASVMTGRWPHELDVEGRGGLDGTYATLAESLRGRGYATAGVVANQFYCGRESGLARGFDDYRDFPLTPGEVLRASTLGWFVSRNARRLADEVIQRLDPGSNAGLSQDFQRKDGSGVNREFLGWLDRRGGRPFFAFLNYFDAHAPYVVPADFRHHFGKVPSSRAERISLRDSTQIGDGPHSPEYLKLIEDSYDDCIASLDRDLGRLFEELTRRGLLEKTVVVVAADHGEQFGEHGRFGHGYSLYEPETRVPLLIVAPGRVPRGKVVRDSVSLRDIPATVLDLLGSRGPSPFPGSSLARTWEGRGHSDLPASELRPLVEPTMEAAQGDNPPTPAAALFDGTHAYIKDQDGREELYDLAADPQQAHDLSAAPESAAILERFRRALDPKAVARREPAR